MPRRAQKTYSIADIAPALAKIAAKHAFEHQLDRAELLLQDIRKHLAGAKQREAMAERFAVPIPPAVLAKYKLLKLWEKRLEDVLCQSKRKTTSTTTVDSKDKSGGKSSAPAVKA